MYVNMSFEFWLGRVVVVVVGICASFLLRMMKKDGNVSSSRCAKNLREERGNGIWNRTGRVERRGETYVRVDCHRQRCHVFFFGLGGLWDGWSK